MIETFGRHDGQDVLRASLSDGDVSVSILNYGAITQDWRVPLKGASVPVVLGFEKFEDYLAQSRYFGVIAGRVANRTAKGQFQLDGRVYQLPINQAPNHLHGGDIGLGRRIWSMEEAGSAAVRLSYHSPDGEEGYPGAVDFTVEISLDGAALTYRMTGVPDRPTPINLAQHSYYSLGDACVLDQTLWLAAHQYTPVDADLIPTGEIVSVAGTHFDFRKPAKIGTMDPSHIGIDLNLVLDKTHDRQSPVASVNSQNGLGLKLWTEEPGLQVFNAATMEIEVPSLDGQSYGPFAGLCLEAQKFPDALNQSHFPSIISTPDQPYEQILKVEIG